MFMAVVLLLFSTPGGQIMSQEIHTTDRYRSARECAADTGSAVALALAQRTQESIIGYEVICVRANDA